ncbi:MAG: quinolinate synthase NadA [FCB group bacterium]|nr:quinolinate synthase NadA [FCB group bacterium]
MYKVVPDKYREATNEELAQFIVEAKSRLGERLTLLAHHYQRLEVAQMSDFVGDSYELSKTASQRKQSEYIVFCGVHFMAESADILSTDEQKVYLPNPLAGCPMADMAAIEDVTAAWQMLEEIGIAGKTIPLSYMNSAAELKAFCGQREGLICTSSNAAAAYKYVYERAEKLFFFPDENLGYNTGRNMGLTDEEMFTWDFRTGEENIDVDRLRRAKLILWRGHCHVHTNFKPFHVEQVREKFPGVKVVVHPECTWDVVEKADAVGSTKFIVNYIDKQPPGAIIAIGTEINLINRMAHRHPDKKIFELSGQTCPVCANMYRTTLADLAFTVENLETRDRIEVDEAIKTDARIALNRMLMVH